jgi:2-octaprenyl-6-methoxyphenol hydroxylase
LTLDRVFDTAVVGAGATGLVAALALAGDGFETCLIGGSAAPTSDGRTVALLDGSVRLLEALGVWTAIKPDASPLATMRIIDDTGSLFRPPQAAFRATEIGLDAFGWNVENAVLVGHLLAHAKAAEHLTLVDHQADGAVVGQELSRISCSDGSTVEARLVVAADGRRSLLRTAAALKTRSWSYPQSALTTILGHDRPHDDASTEFHTRHGPFTLVPLPGRRSSLVWVTSPQKAEELARLDDDALALAIEGQGQSVLGRMTIAGARGVVPMSGLSVDRYHAPRLALVRGRACLSPIGAQGLNLGCATLPLARAWSTARRPGETIGRPQAAERTSAADLDVRLRTAAVDSLNRTLLSGLLPLDFVRGAGLLALGAIGPLRRAVMREGVLPTLGAPG